MSLEQYLINIFEIKVSKPLFVSFSICFLLSLIIIVAKKYLVGGHRAISDLKAIQSVHSAAVPRIGGLAIITAIFISTFFEINQFEITWILVSVLPVFAVGLAEDTGFYVTPINRLLSGVLSGVLVIVTTQVWIEYLNIPIFDWFFQSIAFSVLFTLFATSGVVNAFNLIDGLNGLSGYVIISTSISMSLIAFDVQNYEVSMFLIIVASAVFAFLVLNFPSGLIFLGDAGAYALGHILVWTSVLIVYSNIELSPFAVLLVFFWPVSDTLLAIWRRWRLGNPAGQPDKLHFHHLLMRFLEIKLIGRERRKIANPLTTLVLVPFISFPQIIGVYYSKNTSITVFFTLFITFLFASSYFFILSKAKKK